MQKKTARQAVKLLLMILVIPFLAQAGISGGAAYLESLAPDPWVTQALLASGKSNVALNHLKRVDGVLATDYAKTILAITAAGKDPSVFGSIDYLAKIKTYLNNDQIGDSGLLNDDIWTLIALGACEEGESSAAQSAKNFIISKQNADGGWGYAVNGESDTNDTAAAIIALIEGGVPANGSVVLSAIEYLKTAQNSDGGFGWTVGSASDSGSSAWVIIAMNKLGVNPVSWTKAENNPLLLLASLQDADGGYWWVNPGTSDFNNKAMTPFAVIALSGKSLPLARYVAQANIPDEESGYAIRIEGAEKTICDSRAEGVNVLELIRNASITCGFSYNIKETTFGPYLEKINDEQAGGLNGWLYFVKGQSPAVGMSDYVLSENDEVLVYFGEWGLVPLRASVGKEAYASNETIAIKAEYYAGDEWLALADANIRGLDREYRTGSDGRLDLELSDGYYAFWIEKSGYVRSGRLGFTVGSGVEKNIGLSVEVEAAGTSVSGESLIFTVSPNSLDFGKIKAGASSAQALVVKNEGTADLALSANVDGDPLFRNNLQLDGKSWLDFSRNLQSGATSSLQAELSVPASYAVSGVKSGDLIIWASPK